MFKKRNYLEIIQNMAENPTDQLSLEQKIEENAYENERVTEYLYEDPGVKYKDSDTDENEEEYSENEDEEEYEDDEGGDYMNPNEEIEMVNEWNANKRTGVIIDVYEKNEKNKEFNKNVYIYSKKINEDINDADYEINDGDIKNIQILAGRIDDVQYKNTVCFILAYKFISMSKQKNEYLDFVNIYIPILNDIFGYMNIGKKDFIRYIIFIKNIIKHKI